MSKKGIIDMIVIKGLEQTTLGEISVDFRDIYIYSNRSRLFLAQNRKEERWFLVSDISSRNNFEEEHFLFVEISEQRAGCIINNTMPVYDVFKEPQRYQDHEVYRVCFREGKLTHFSIVEPENLKDEDLPSKGSFLEELDKE